VNVVEGLVSMPAVRVFNSSIVTLCFGLVEVIPLMVELFMYFFKNIQVKV